jgi:hypothetical protein
MAACDSKPVVVVATPPPPDANFRTYRHTSGVFSLRLPADWAVRDVSQPGALRVEFSPPANPGLPLTVYIVNTGAALTASALLDYLDRYQNAVNQGASYHEISRSAQGDGSWRVVGVRQSPIGPRTLNTFLQADGPFLTAAEIDLTGYTEAQLLTMRAVLNTLRVDSGAMIPSGALEAALPAPETGQTVGTVAFSSLHTWTTPAGDFVINGLVTNRSGSSLEAVIVTASLYDAQGSLLAEQQTVAPLEILADGGVSPFGVRFRGGKPSQTVRFELDAAARYAEYALQTHLKEDKFIRGNDKASYNAAGLLTVSGDVVNQSGGPAYFVKAVVTVFDDQSRVVGFSSVFLQKSPLLPGDVDRFEVTFPELGGGAIRYALALEGRSAQ